jgi:hypothetical protein
VFETPGSITETLEFARWQIPLEAHERKQFEIRERLSQTRFEEVRNLNGAQLQMYLENKFLDKQTHAALEHVLTQYLNINTINQDLSKLEQERSRIAARQAQIQANLVSLGREREEGKLRARLVKELGSLEDRLQAMQNEEDKLRKQIAELVRGRNTLRPYGNCFVILADSCAGEACFAPTKNDQARSGLG